jgi:hypothetical protein
MKKERSKVFRSHEAHFIQPAEKNALGRQGQRSKQQKHRDPYDSARKNEKALAGKNQESQQEQRGK